YTHFYAKELKTGYYTLGARMLGYGGLTYVLANSENDIKWKDILGLQIDEADVKNGNNGTQNTITAISLTLIFGSYFFDWIHGKSVLEIKQEKIRFKYSLLKMSTYNQIHDNHVEGPDYIPLALFTISF
ncbi:MAG TPA: hypothetical protein VJ939_02580, partial [Bacteroidales bacterium]|nr:hypothetical protein [Bacteroidales bacterium]